MSVEISYLNGPFSRKMQRTKENHFSIKKG